MNKKILIILLNVLLIACIVLIGIAPIIPTAIAGNIASANGCDLDEGSIHVLSTAWIMAKRSIPWA